MIFVALADADKRDELLLVDGGMCRFHLRRDGVVVIHELYVLRENRGQGIGRELVERVRNRHPGRTVRARCPRIYPSNSFWRHMGFELTEEGEINTWELNTPSHPRQVPVSK